MFTIQNLKSFLHPVMMTVLFMPFAYCLALAMKYELLFVRIKFLSADENTKRQIRREIVKQVKFNLNKLKRVNKNLNRSMSESEDVKAFVNELAES